MLKRTLLTVMLFIFIAGSVNARTIGGVELDESFQPEDSTTALILNGGGIRKKLFMDIYVAGLYLAKKNTDYNDIINKDEDMAIRIEILSKLITSDRFKEATEEGFKRTTNNNTSFIRKQIDKSMTVFDAKFNVGDVFDIIYISGTGTKFYKNGKYIDTVEGMDFKKALFGIWIIDRPSHKCKNLRLGMLGLK